MRSVHASHETNALEAYLCTGQARRVTLPLSLLLVVLAPAAAPAEAEPAPAQVFPRGGYLTFGPSVGGMTVLAERRSALTTGFLFEGGYLFSRFANRPNLRIALGASFLHERQLLYADKVFRFEWMAKVRIGTELRRAFAYAVLGAGPSMWRVRDEGSRRVALQAAGSVGLGIVWALCGRTSLGLEADVGASAATLEDAQVRWSARLVLMRHFGRPKAHHRHHRRRHSRR